MQPATPTLTASRFIRAPYAMPKSKVRCQCGKCPRCLDNARWERIYQEKFADPDYYTPRVPVCGSSLGWL